MVILLDRKQGTFYPCLGKLGKLQDEAENLTQTIDPNAMTDTSNEHAKNGFVLPYAPEKEYYFKEGCFILELLNDSDDALCSIARARVEPGKTTRWHRLRGTSERYLIQEGEGLVEYANVRQRVSVGDVVVIPENIPQRIHNAGKDMLVFLAICTPRFLPENYTDIEAEEGQARL